MPDKLIPGESRSPVYKKGRAKSSTFQMKGSPMQRNFGIGASPVKQTEEDDTEGYHTVKDTSNILTETGQGVDVTDEYRKTGSKKTREAIESGATVYKHPATGQISIQYS